MSVFTVFFCGTASTSDDYKNPDYVKGELISTLGKNAIGEAYIDYLVVDGVGSGNKNSLTMLSNKNSHSTLSGIAFGKGINQNIDHVMNVIKGDLSSHSAITPEQAKKYGKEKLAETKPTGRNKYQARKRTKNIFGFSVPYVGRERTQKRRDWDAKAKHKGQEMVNESFLAYKHLAQARSTNPITKVNMIGWSRGGVTCFELANRMFADPDLRHIPVNIFACDPVPGASNNFKNHHALNRNVNMVVCLYAQHERSTGFSARMPRLHHNTKVFTSLMPGKHATLVGNAHQNGQSKGLNIYDEPGRITRDFAEKVLTGWGSRLRGTLKYTTDDVLTLYQMILKFMPDYKKMKNSTYTIKGRFQTTSNRIQITKQRKNEHSFDYHGNPASIQDFPGLSKLRFSELGYVNRHHYDIACLHDKFAAKGVGEPIDHRKHRMNVFADATLIYENKPFYDY